MCLCFGVISVRTDCIKSFLCELLVFSLLIIIICPTKYSPIKLKHGTVNRILLAPLILAIIAALCLFVGALLVSSLVLTFDPYLSLDMPISSYTDS